MGNEMVPDARYLPVILEEWGITAHWVFAEDGGKYLAIRAQCEELGVAPGRQLQRITDTEDDHYAAPGALRKFRIETPGGRQVARCLRKAEAAWWIASISPQKLKPALRGQMERIRAAILMSADRIVWGDMTNVRAVATIAPHGGNVHVGGCPRCHTPLIWVMRPGDMHLEIAE